MGILILISFITCFRMYRWKSYRCILFIWNSYYKAYITPVLQSEDVIWDNSTDWPDPWNTCVSGPWVWPDCSDFTHSFVAVFVCSCEVQLWLVWRWGVEEGLSCQFTPIDDFAQQFPSPYPCSLGWLPMGGADCRALSHAHVQGFMQALGTEVGHHSTLSIYKDLSPIYVSSWICEHVHLANKSPKGWLFFYPEKKAFWLIYIK